MINSATIEKSIKGKYTCDNFNRFVPNKDCIFPDLRMYDFMVLGPFVLETDGAFETEYFYEREKILDHDYLLSSGGEANQIPYLGQSVKNDYYGPGTLKWRKGYNKWDALRFDKEGDDCDDALFVTEQRNCVFYAATYIECDKEQDAVLVHESSGCKIYLNGELIDNKPYGRVKGMSSNGYKVSVHFNKGKNLLLFKVRPGYIADSMDITISNCSIYPVAVQTPNFGITYPLPTGLFFGSRENPLQMIQCYAWTKDGFENGKLVYSHGEFASEEVFENLQPTESRLIRLKVPTSDKVEIYPLCISVNDGINSVVGSIDIETAALTPYEGIDHKFSDFHFDTTYHQEQRTYALGAFHITRCIVDKLIQDPDFKAILSEVDYLHPYYSIYPHHREAIKEAFSNARAEADCFYNQPNELTSSGEGFVRNLVYGQLYHRDVLGRITPVYAPGDVFGHPNQMTQMCLKGGCRAMRWGKQVLGLDSVFRHVSPDGTIGLHKKSLDRNNAMRLKLNHSNGGMEIVGKSVAIQTDCPTGWAKESLNKSHYAVFSELLDGLLEDVEQAEIRKERTVDIVSRDMTQHHSGVLLTRTDFKQANRLAENLLITAEKFSAIASFYGAKYPEKAIDKAWRQLLCAQHHDSVTGTNNEISFVDLMIEYREAVELAADVVNRAIAFLANGVEIEENEIPYVIFNPHSWARKDKCEISVPDSFADGCELIDSKGNAYPASIIENGNGLKAVFTPDVPALGFETYVLKKADCDKIVSGNDKIVENEFYKITVDENLGGGVVSIIDKEENKEVIDITKDGPANRVVVLKELHDRMETQHEFYTTGHKMFSSDYPASVTSEKCREFEKLTIKVRLDIVAEIKQEITLWKNIKRIDMKTSVDDYQGIDDLFVLTFPLDIENSQPIFDDRFAPHVWSRSQRKLSFQTHQYASFSHSKIAPVNQWIELGRTVRCLFENGDTNIGMTAIIRNPSLYELTDDLLIALSKKAVPVTPYSDCDQYGGGKIVHFNEDLDNTDTRFVLSIQGVSNEYEDKLLSETDEKFVCAFNENLNKNSVSVLFTRDYDNIYNKSIDVILIKGKTENDLTDRIAKIRDELNLGKTVDFSDAVLAVEPGKTEDYGVALINNGNIACSVEPDNLMTMMLFHTAEFYGNNGKTTGDAELVPEQKTHVFSYCLYPHKGDYREAEVYKKAFEFNDPLLCAAPKNSGNILPKSKSFVETDSNFLITSFKAGGYPMASMKNDLGNVQSRGFSIRGFEIDGVEKETKIKTAFNILNAEKTNLLEEDGCEITSENGTISFTTPPHSIETFTFTAENDSVIGNDVLGAENEVVEPSYVRSWEHDLGSMNIGYLNVAGVIGKDVEKISDTEFRFNISMANNHPDTSIKGTMNLTLSEGFKADITSIPYEVEAGGIFVKQVVVTKPSKDAKGIIRLGYNHDNQEFEDLYEFGYFNPEVSLEIVDNKIIATVINNTSERLYGELALATPIETWNAGNLNPNSRMDIYPSKQKFDVEANSSKEYVFEATDGNDSLTDAYWAVVKLMANGRIHFAYDCKKGPRHNVWAHEFYHVLFGRDKGSIEELLKL